MQKLQVQSSIPAGGPDTLTVSAGTTPKVCQVGITNELHVVALSSLGTFTVRPYYWMASYNNGSGAWVAVGGDATSPQSAANCDATKFGGWADVRMKSPCSSGYFCLVKEAGTGTVAEAWLGVIPNKIT